MTLYYNTNNYEIKDLSDDLINGWTQNDNPKKDKWILLPEKPGNDYYWSNGQWIQYTQTVPESISARQIRLWLINNGIQLIQVEQAIDNIEDQLIRETTKIEWEYAPYVERSHPWVEQLGSILGLNPSQIDSAFIEASKL